MTTWKPISLEDKEMINSFTKNRFSTCDLLFSTLFLWSKGDHLEYKIDRECLLIRGHDEGERFAYPPVSKTGDIEALVESFQELLEDSIPIICIPEEYVNLLGNRFDFKEYRDSFDYIYLQEDLAFLKGRRYSKKKNKINKFLSLYDFQYEKIDDSNLSEVLEFQKRWQIEKEGDSLAVLRSEHVGILSIFENYHSLDLKGGLIRVDGKIIAYALGEILKEDMGVIHIEKADSSYVGSYQMINSLFAQKEFRDVTYLNREDDYGDEGIRQAKESYHPSVLLKKYTIPVK